MHEHSLNWNLGLRVSLEDPACHIAGGHDYRTILDGRGDPIALVLDDLGDDECSNNVDIIVDAPKYRKVLEQIARMIKNGDLIEEDMEGEMAQEYEMSIDDAFDTASACLRLAREVLGWPDPMVVEESEDE